MTKTSSFGTSKREGHDSSEFYQRNLYYKFFREPASEKDLKVEVPHYDGWADHIYSKSATNMDNIPDNSVALAFTSPPCVIAKGNNDDMGFEEYLDLMRDVGKEVYRVLRPGGRYVINVANLGNKPYIPLHSFFYQLYVEELGFLPMGEIIWQKNKAASNAEYSRPSAKSPRLEDIHEYLLVFAKQAYSRPDKGESTIDRDEFMAATLSVWEIAPESANTDHLIPFPKELAKRVIRLYSYVDDVILDPFVGLGTTCVAAKGLNRHYIGFDISTEHCSLADQRLDRTYWGEFIDSQRELPGVELETKNGEQERSNEHFYGHISKTELNVKIPDHIGWADKILEQSATDMTENIPDNGIALAFTSPPYNVGKDYDDDMGFDEYLDLIRKVGQEVYRVLRPGGRYLINIANLGRKPYIPLHSFFHRLHIEELGFLPMGEIIWRKGRGASNSCAWGSWRSAKAPRLRDIHEYILVFTKQTYSRPDWGESTITPDEFISATQSIWEIAPESAKRVGHPAPFPVELASRVINLYSYLNDVVLDPFVGSGTTCVAAKILGRHYVGYDISPEYCAMARERLAQTPQFEHNHPQLKLPGIKPVTGNNEQE